MPGAPGTKPSPAFSEYFCRRQLNSSAIVTLITSGNYWQLTLGFACTPAAACCNDRGSAGLVVVPTGPQEQHCRLGGPGDDSGGRRMQFRAPHPLHPKKHPQTGTPYKSPRARQRHAQQYPATVAWRPLAPRSASPWQWTRKWGFCPQTSHSQQPYPTPSQWWRASSRQSIPVPPLCFVQGFLLLLLLPSPAHYYYDFILMQKRFHKRPLSLPRGAGPTPASLECSPAAKRPRTGPAQGRAVPHVPLGMLT